MTLKSTFAKYKKGKAASLGARPYLPPGYAIDHKSYGLFTLHKMQGDSLVQPPMAQLPNVREARVFAWEDFDRVNKCTCERYPNAIAIKCPVHGAK